MQGEFYAEFDKETCMWCVFHTDIETGKAYSSWATLEQAIEDADSRNQDAAQRKGQHSMMSKEALQVCECADTNCPNHVGASHCPNLATERLFRVDMGDESGTDFCPACADDAFESGLFTTGECQ